MNDVENNKELQEGASKKRVQTTAQLPVYRTATEAMLLLADAVKNTPRKLLRYTDRVLLDAGELLKCLAIANEFRGEERRYYLTLALADVQVVKTNALILKRQGCLSGDRYSTLTKQLKSVGAQVAAWRDSVKREGQ